jgi:hypothetical protein
MRSASPSGPAKVSARNARASCTNLSPRATSNTCAPMNASEERNRSGPRGLRHERASVAYMEAGLPVRSRCSRSHTRSSTRGSTIASGHAHRPERPASHLAARVGVHLLPVKGPAISRARQRPAASPLRGVARALSDLTVRLDDNQRPRRGRPATALPGEPESTRLDADATSPALPLQQAQQQRPRHATCLLTRAPRAARVSGRPAR